MSGIAGILVNDSAEPAPLALLPAFRRMIDSLAHRGPDGAGTWQGTGCLLGALAFHTTPESSTERQPIEDPQSGLVLVWDGRLDNRRELLEKLGEPGESLSDAALVLRAFIRWTENCVARLTGDFAFAIWDPQCRSLFTARDPLGIRPFFYFSEGSRFCFASEVQSILRLSDVPAELDEVMIGDFLVGWADFAQPERTFLRAVRRLLPAHWLRWTAGRVEVHRYWRVEAERRLRYPRREDYAEEFGKLFREAVECRMRARSPVGVFLSGGLDSGAVISAAARLPGASRVLRAYTIALSDERDESAVASRVTGELGVEHIRVPFARGNSLEGVASRLERQASPFMEEGWIQEANLFTRAAADGVRVVLTGDGGDEMFNFPWAYVADLVRRGRWGKLLRELGPFARYHHRTPVEMLRLGLPLLAPGAVRRFWKRLKWREAPTWIDPRFAERIELVNRLRQMRPRLQFDSLSADADHHSFTRGRMVLMHEQREWAAAQHGVEYRFPFYDRRLLEFLLAVPWERKTESGRPKSLLRDATGILPASLRELREKADCARGSEQNLREAAGEALRLLFDNPPPRALDCVRGREARRLCREFLAGVDEVQKTVWILACFFLWIRSTPFGIKDTVLGKEWNCEEGAQASGVSA